MAKNAVIRSEDSVAWNWIKAMKSHSEKGGDDGGVFDAASDPDVEDSESNHPLVWSGIYFVCLTLLTRKNMYNFF